MHVPTLVREDADQRLSPVGQYQLLRENWTDALDQAAAEVPLDTLSRGRRPVFILEERLRRLGLLVRKCRTGGEQKLTLRIVLTVTSLGELPIEHSIAVHAAMRAGVIIAEIIRHLFVRHSHQVSVLAPA